MERNIKYKIETQPKNKELSYEITSGSFLETLSNTTLIFSVLNNLLDAHKDVLVFEDINGTRNILMYMIIQRLQNKEVPFPKINLEISYVFDVSEDLKIIESESNKLVFELREETSIEDITIFFLNVLSVLSSEYLKSLNIPIGNIEVNQYLDGIFESDFNVFPHVYGNLFEQFHEIYHK